MKKRISVKNEVKDKINIGIFFGGRSSEHEVSLISAKSIINSIDTKKFNIIPIGITKEGNFLYLKDSLEPNEIIKNGEPVIFISQPKYLQNNIWILDKNNNVKETLKIDIAFPILHGPFGEDGKIQALFEMANIPYVGSEVLGSACGMDKIAMKYLFKANKLPVVNFIHFTAYDYENNYKTILKNIKSNLKLPYFVKPANLGSSVGITKVNKLTDLKPAIEEALKYDYKVLVEQGHNVREIEVAIMGNFNLLVAEPGEIIPHAEFYDYNDKYKNNQAKFSIPAKLPAKKLKEIKELAILAYKAIDAKGFARIDFFIDKISNKIYLNEINTIPGFTSISMFPKMFEAFGIKYKQIVNNLINYAFELFKYKQRLKV